MSNLATLSDDQKTTLIRKGIIQAGKAFKDRHPVLKHQNAIGFGIFLSSVSMIIGASALYLSGSLSVWILIPWNAFWMGLLHELEHDLIHRMYFRKNPLVHNFMLLVGWILRPLTVNPWFRRDLHFHHHKYSGTLHDVEERGVTNGEKWSFKRLITTPDLLLGGILRATSIRKDLIEAVKSGDLDRKQALRFKYIKQYGMLPFSLLAYLLWYVFLVHYALHGFAGMIGWEYASPAWLQSQFVWINPLVAILIAPNILRQFCLHFITSNMHYFGDIESGNVLQQTQVLDVWWTFPMQIFCFFFGWTHAIHHFHVNETFYIRHFTRWKAYEVMEQYGVRFNDLGTFRRANRYHTPTAQHILRTQQ
jgi:fatty acid desaturase